MRVWLGGSGDPIPEIALPDASMGDVVPIILEPDNGELFKPLDYTALGYTYYEAWCVGAAGGEGGEATDRCGWIKGEPYTHVMTDSEWAQYIAWNFSLPFYQVLVRSYPTTWAYMTGVQYAEYMSPGRQIIYNPHTDPYFTERYTGPVTGGAGGGGGLQVVLGRLDELPDEVLCTIGQAGADGARGYENDPDGWDPVPEYPQHSWRDIDVYPDPHPILPIPTEGEDGGASSFGEICMASGGKGGNSAVFFRAPHLGVRQKAYDGQGGDGGIGGSLEAGGGAKGAAPVHEHGKDGRWDPITRIGSGGGGGRGGYVQFPDNRDYHHSYRAEGQ